MCLSKNGRYRYLCMVPSEVAHDKKALTEFLKKRYPGIRIFPGKAKYLRKQMFKPFKVLSDVIVYRISDNPRRLEEYRGDLWVRTSNGYPYLCICQGFRVVGRLKRLYMPDYNAFEFQAKQKESQILWFVHSWLNSRDGKARYRITFDIKPRPFREDEGMLQEVQDMAEDWGWGTVEDELLEDGDSETLEELRDEGYIDSEEE